MADLDKLDVDLLRLIVTEPRAGMREYSRRLGIARGTATARLDKLIAAGVLPDFAPSLDPRDLQFILAPGGEDNEDEDLLPES